MRHMNVAALAVSMVAFSSVVGAQTLEVGYPHSDWFSIGAPINSPDPEAITVDPLTGNVVLTNGNDTDDGDGDSVISFTQGGPGDYVKAYTRGNEMEARIAAYTGGVVTDFRNVSFVGIGANLRGDIIVPLDNSRSNPTAAWLVRVNADSSWTDTANDTSIDILAGSTDVNGPIDGTIHIAMDGNTIYLLQRSLGGAPETRVVAFDSTGGDQQVPTVVLSQADLLAVMSEAVLDELNGIAIGSILAGGVAEPSTRVKSLVLVAGEPDLVGGLPASSNLYAMPLTGSGSLGLLKSGASLDADAKASRDGYGGFLGIERGAISINSANGDIYLATWDLEQPGFFDNYDFLRIEGDSLTGEVFLTEAEIEADPVYIAEGGPGEVESQSYGLAVGGSHLYITLETETSNTDFYGRLSIPMPVVVTPDGDINGDGVVNVADVTFLANVVKGLAVLPPGANGDIDNDGNVDGADVDFLVDQIVNP